MKHSTARKYHLINNYNTVTINSQLWGRRVRGTSVSWPLFCLLFQSSDLVRQMALSAFGNCYCLLLHLCSPGIRTWRSSVYVNSGIQLWASLVQVYDGFNRKWPRTLCPVEREVPALAAGAPALEPQGPAEEHAQSAVRPHLGKGTFLTGDKMLWYKPLGFNLLIFYVFIFRTHVQEYIYFKMLWLFSLVPSGKKK